MKGQIPKMYDLKKDLDIKRAIQTHSGSIMKIAVSIFIILDIILKKPCFDLICIEVFILLIEHIMQYHKSKHKEDLIGSVLLAIGLVCVFVLYLLN